MAVAEYIKKIQLIFVKMCVGASLECGLRVIITRTGFRFDIIVQAAYTIKTSISMHMHALVRVRVHMFLRDVGGSLHVRANWCVTD
jgi:hypothetical protein